MANLTSEELESLQGSLKEFNKCWYKQINEC